MLSRIFSRTRKVGSLASSTLYNNTDFYQAFEEDLRLCRREALIESPFMTVRRLRLLLPQMSKARSRGVRIIVNTKPPEESGGSLQAEAEQCIRELQNLGVEILLTGGHHRKLAVFDRQLLWEGSLNILSQNDSCEIMRRISDKSAVEQMIDFIKLRPYLK